MLSSERMQSARSTRECTTSYFCVCLCARERMCRTRMCVYDVIHIRVFVLCAPARIRAHARALPLFPPGAIDSKTIFFLGSGVGISCCRCQCAWQMSLTSGPRVASPCCCLLQLFSYVELWISARCMRVFFSVRSHIQHMRGEDF